MTDNKNETKSKKLKLPSKMVTSKAIDHTKLRSSYITSRNSNITVEIKNCKKANIYASDVKFINAQSNSELLTENEFNKKINILKKAATFAKTEEYKNNLHNTCLEIQDVLKEGESNKNLEQEQANNSTENLKEVIEETKVEDISLKKTKDNTVLLHKNQKEPQTPSYSLVNSVTNSKVGDENSEIQKIVEIDEKKATIFKGNIGRLKKDNNRKFKKTDIYQMLDENNDSRSKSRSLASIKRAREKEKRKSQENSLQEKIHREVVIGETITVSELASRMSEKTTDVICKLREFGITDNDSQNIDTDIAELIATSYGHSVKRVQDSDVENILKIEQDAPESLKFRAPVVTIMGHVDHGKTSLLDALKSTDIVSTESGGITQHIGAYRVNLPNGHAITFIDTPGHEAFTEMRTRGAQITDIVVLVVAADDGIKTQTIEAINHAKAAKVPILVAVNKIDKPNANVEKVKQELLAYDLIPEDLGGDTIIVPISALQKLNLDKLEDAILLIAEMLDLKANPIAPASGAVIESKIDKQSGVIATVLIQRGTLKIGDIIVAGECFGKIKKIINDKEQNLTHAYPSEPVKILGLNQVPNAGDKISVVQNEKQARDIIDYRTRKVKEKKNSIARASLEELFKQAAKDKSKELPIILKTDVAGSLEAIRTSLNKIINDEVKIKILHTAVGAITESDTTLAKASNAIILGFNVRANQTANQKAEKDKIDIRYYSVIYNLIDDVKAILSGMLSPIIREKYTGSAEVRKVFNITKVGKIAGCYVTKGYIKRGSEVRLIRDNIIVYKGTIKTLRHIKDDIKETRENSECGIELNNYDDIKIGDVIEAFEVAEEKQKIN